jgi:hypothetical protein
VRKRRPGLMIQKILFSLHIFDNGIVREASSSAGNDSPSLSAQALGAPGGQSRSMTSDLIVALSVLTSRARNVTVTLTSSV